MNDRRQNATGELVDFAGDLSTPEAAELLAREYPAVEILINNLGICEPARIGDYGSRAKGRRQRHQGRGLIEDRIASSGGKRVSSCASR
ncbi:MAG: hypothetical protein WBG92_17605 [Thiohalocapsa sp.]